MGLLWVPTVFGWCGLNEDVDPRLVNVGDSGGAQVDYLRGMVLLMPLRLWNWIAPIEYVRFRWCSGRLAAWHGIADAAWDV